MPIRLSAVIPVHDEEASLAGLLAELTSVLATIEGESEILVVNDGSTDSTRAVLEGLRARHPTLRPLHLRRRCGQTAALLAGFDRARGDVVVTLDGDLQNDPADIPRLLEALDVGNDIASGWRRRRKDGFLARRLPSSAANWLARRWLGIRLHDHGCALKAYRRSVVKEIVLYGDLHRLVVAAGSVLGARVAEVEVAHRARLHGRSKYGLGRAFQVLLDLLALALITRWRNRPSRWFLGVALPFAALAFLFGALAVLSPAARGPDARIVFSGAALILGFGAAANLLLGLFAETFHRILPLRASPAGGLHHEEFAA